MGRSRRKGVTGTQPERSISETTSSPLPGKSSLLLELEDGHITYFNPEEGKMRYIDAQIEVILDGDQDNFKDEIREMEDRLFDIAKQQLHATGEIDRKSVV
jgi:hypothetical protein